MWALPMILTMTAPRLAENRFQRIWFCLEADLEFVELELGLEPPLLPSSGMCRMFLSSVRQSFTPFVRDCF